jgi:hypothetical protein
MNLERTLCLIAEVFILVSRAILALVEPILVCFDCLRWRFALRRCHKRNVSVATIYVKS